jgi:chromosome partitioning protein
MKTIAFFNNKGGVGKTSLVYHLAWMLAEQGVKVLAADLDPQANLTSMAFREEALELFWNEHPRPTVFTAIAPIKRGVGDLVQVEPKMLGSRLGCLIGDLSLSEFEDDLSQNWPKCLDRDERAFRVTTAIYRAVRAAAIRMEANVILIDVGPNLGALNRAAMIAADSIVVPVAPDLFSVQGLENVGPRLRTWREEWQERLARAPRALERDDLPPGSMQPLGYVVARHTVRAERPVKSYQRWIDRLPQAYDRSVLGKEDGRSSSPGEPNLLGRLKDYRSLMPMAQEATKPMFLLKPADGAIGGHQSAVQSCYGDFLELARKIAFRAGIEFKSRH